MADTVDLSEITEFYDSAGMLESKVRQLADLVRASKRVVVFTGAGISAAAKIPTFRGPEGVWTRQAQGRAPPKSISMEMAMPTYAHRAIKALMDAGRVSYVVSQNVDGLHRRSGIAADGISELHGNCFLEQCWRCEADYLRTWDVCAHRAGVVCRECRTRAPHFCHCTGRVCEREGCGGRLKDSIIHFKENLPARALRRAMRETAKADLVIAVGSSLRVTPACEVPMESVRRGGKLVIINLQTTPYDRLCADDRRGDTRAGRVQCDRRIWGDAEAVFKALMGHLGLAAGAADSRALHGPSRAVGAVGAAGAGADADAAAAVVSVAADGGGAHADADEGEEEGKRPHAHEASRGRARSEAPATARAPAVRAAATVAATPAPAATRGARAAAAAEHGTRGGCIDAVEIGNTHRYLAPGEAGAGADGTHEWTLFVREPAASGLPAGAVAAAVEEVTFELHPTFSPSVVRVTAPKRGAACAALCGGGGARREGPLAITRWGWGTFDVRVRVTFTEASGLAPLTAVHSLCFDAPETSRAVATARRGSAVGAAA